MALYQPSFCVPHNQAIDATDENDMKFSFKLNGNNPLVAYNIQIFNNDTNELVYELVSTENERVIQARIQELSGWLQLQDTKAARADEAEEEYESSEIKSEFRNALRTAVQRDKSKLSDMEEILQKKKDGKTLGQTEITKYFEYWQDIITDLEKYIGDEENPTTKTGEYVLQTLEGWLNIDPARTDGIEYTGDVELIDRSRMDTVKSLFQAFKTYYEETEAARILAGASDTTYISDTTLTKARQALYLMYSQYSNESYFGNDLYEAVNSVWNETDFDELRQSIENYKELWQNEETQQEYALAHLDGGQTTQEVNVYNDASASDTNIAYTLPKDAQVAILTGVITPPSGWYYISSGGKFGYIESQYVNMYNIENTKYYLEKPIYPNNYEGEANTVTHQIPINVLENGNAYKWSVTLYWSTSGRYNEDDKIDGSLISVENYFDTRKKPVVYLKNLKEVFTIPYNYVTTNQAITFANEGVTVTISEGASVRIVNLTDNGENAYVEYIDEANDQAYYTVVPTSSLNGIGLYNTSTNYILPSKKIEFIGGYEQEQFVSMSYFRWVLCRLQTTTEEVVEVVKDTGMVPSVDFRFFYDGFLNDTKYSIQLFVQTLDNVEACTEPIKFKTSYITYEIQNMVNAENSPIEHGIIVEWSNLRLIRGEVEGGNRYISNIPTEEKTSLQLDEDGYLVFDKDKGKPMSIDWDANQILSVRFDEERPEEEKIYYTASGLDDNGDVISKTLQMIPTEETQDTGYVILRYTIKTAKNIEYFDEKILASALYWYIIILKKDGFVIFRKYAEGLFPALDQYPALNKFTGELGLYPDALTYLEEPSNEVEYNYQQIVDRRGNKREDGE